jgi:hypothetical protein
MPSSKAAANHHLIRGDWDHPSYPTPFFSIRLDSLACHELIRLIDRIDFFHCHIELRS